MKFVYPEGATPLNEEERQALIPSHIRTQEELNAFENLNIAQSIPWAFQQKLILTPRFFQKLHQKMFGQTWRWAGQFRKSQKNIGVEAYRIELELHQLSRDVSFQIENQSFDPDEIAIRFHHRLVLIHAFVNGNGRHARLVSDLLIRSLDQSVFSWGAKTFKSSDLSALNPMRTAYIEALRNADHHDYTALLRFARS